MTEDAALPSGEILDVHQKQRRMYRPEVQADDYLVPTSGYFMEVWASIWN
jgi:hypothetical protein